MTFFNPIFIPCFSGSMFSGSRFFRAHVFQGSRFFRVQLFQGPGFSGYRFFRLQVFKGPGFSGFRLFRVQVFQGPGFSGSRFFRVRVQVLEVAEQKVLYEKVVLNNFAIFRGKYLCWRLFFNKNVGLQACNFIKKRLQHRCKYCQIFKNTYFEEHL